MTTKEPLWIWIPNVQLSNLYFNQPYPDFETFIQNNFMWEHKSYMEEDIYESDSKGGSFHFCGKNHIFGHAEIWSNLYYQGHNLIGLSEDQLEKVLAVNDFDYDKDRKSVV